MAKPVVMRAVSTALGCFTVAKSRSYSNPVQQYCMHSLACRLYPRRSGRNPRSHSNAQISDNTPLEQRTEGGYCNSVREWNFDRDRRTNGRSDETDIRYSISDTPTVTCTETSCSRDSQTARRRTLEFDRRSHARARKSLRGCCGSRQHASVAFRKPPVWSCSCAALPRGRRHRGVWG